MNYLTIPKNIYKSKAKNMKPEKTQKKCKRNSNQHSKLQEVYCVHTIRFRLSVRVLCLQQLETFWKAKQLYNHYQIVSIFILRK